MRKKYGALSSSVDPEKLSLSVKGVLLGLLPIAIVLLKIDQETATGIINGIVELVKYGASIVSVCVTLYGLYRKWRVPKES